MAQATEGLLTNNLLTPKELAHVQTLVDAHHADRAVAFYLDRARELINANTHHNAETTKQALAYLKDGINLAHNQQVHGPLVEKLHGTYVFAERWGGLWTGTAKEVSEATAHAEAAGHVMDNLGERIMPFLQAKVPVLNQ